MIDLKTLSNIAAGNHPAALCSVVKTQGSTPRKVGAQMIVVADGSSHGEVRGTIGGGAVEHRVREAALLAIAQGAPRTVDFALSSQLGMCCGGQMSVFIDPLRSKAPCIVLGAGHCGQAIANAAALTGFDVTLADPREDLLNTEVLDKSITTLSDYEDDDFDDMPFGPDAYVVVVTHDHAVDQALVERVFGRDYRYLALIGSERKSRLTRERAKNKGFDEERIKALRCPAGIDIGAETPEEIALSVVAEMVSIRRRGEIAEAKTQSVDDAKKRA